MNYRIIETTDNKFVGKIVEFDLIVGEIINLSSKVKMPIVRFSTNENLTTISNYNYIIKVISR